VGNFSRDPGSNTTLVSGFGQTKHNPIKSEDNQQASHHIQKVIPNLKRTINHEHPYLTPDIILHYRSLDVT
jgi:hypothetical protein